MGEAVKENRIFQIFYRLLGGEAISVKKMSELYGCSSKTVSRYISSIKNFFADNRELCGNSEITYDYWSKTYSLKTERSFSPEEITAIIKMLIGARGLGKKELLEVIGKLKSFVGAKDRAYVEELIRKEIFHYQEIRHDCDSVIANVWKLTQCIEKNNEITITYYKMSREMVTRVLWPVAVIFSEYYYYLLAYDTKVEEAVARFYRVDRITEIVSHRKQYKLPPTYNVDEGALKEKIQYMFPGSYTHIRFSFCGPSVQAILDKMPTARIVEKKKNEYILEADVYGDGVKMFLLSQGSWVRILSPQKYVDEFTAEIEKMMKQYK